MISCAILDPSCQIQGIYKKYYYPYKFLCIDEKMVAGRGCTKWKQYTTDNPMKFRFKIFVFCDAETN